MRCLDTPLLEDLLLGKKRVMTWLPSLEVGAEVATTEVNLYELALSARGARPPGQARRRLSSLEEVRKALTILPLDPEATRRSWELVGRSGTIPQGFAALVLGICEAHGVDELYTSRSRKLPKGHRSVKVVRV